MVLQAYKERTFKAEIKFEDDSTKEVVFRLPRNTDVYVGDDGNSNVATLYTLANMAKPFDTPIQVGSADGSVLNVKTVRELIDLGVVINFSDAVEKWLEEKEKAQAEKDRLTKKSESAGGSGKKVTPPAEG